MRRHRRKQLRYGLSSGILAFAAGWAVAAFLTPETAFNRHPRWQSTIWVYLGAHLVELSAIYTDGGAMNTVQPLQVANIPSYLQLVPVVAVAIAAFYTCHRITSSRIKNNISNAVAAGMSYFLIALVAMVVSNVRPTISMMLLLALIVGGGIWLGSSFLGSVTRGLPFIGIASLGSVAAIGILLFLGGIALVSVIWGVVAMSFGTATITGGLVGFTRRLERRGRRYNTQYSRLRGLQDLLEGYWKEILVVTVVTVALIVGVSGGV